VQAEGSCIGCFAERQETTSDLDDEGALGALVERIGERGTGESLHDVEADEYYAHFWALDSHEFVFGEVEGDRPAEEHVIECIYCKSLEASSIEIFKGRHFGGVVLPEPPHRFSLHLLSNGERMSNRKEASNVPFCEGSWIEITRAPKDNVSHVPPMMRTQQKAFRYRIAS
jgi:hypothetical protein